MRKPWPCNDLRQRRPQQQRHVAACQRQAAADVAADAAGAGDDDARMSGLSHRAAALSQKRPHAADAGQGADHVDKLVFVQELEG